MATQELSQNTQISFSKSINPTQSVLQPTGRTAPDVAGMGQRSLAMEETVLVPLKDQPSSESIKIEKDCIELIRELASRTENQDVASSWYIIVACGLTAAGQGPLVAQLYNIVIEPYKEDFEAQRLVLRRIKESLIKTASVFGVPRLLNAFFPLITCLPSPTPNETTALRDNSLSIEHASSRGEVYMRRVFGSGDLDSFLSTLQESWPDLKSLIVDDVYGKYQAEVSIIGPVETSMINIATLVAMDCPKEVGWHMRGLINNGGTLQEAGMVFEIAKKVVDIAQVVLKGALPAVDDVVGKERLISRAG